MTIPIVPSIWILVLIAGISQFGETVYSPSLPDIALDLKTSESMVEYTLTIYLIGFALGILFWGKLSDKLGRKPCIIAGLIIFIIGCLGCYLSTSITALMLSRVIQAFGGSIGSVLGQAVTRDSFHGPALGRVYSSVGSALALFPAIGPIIGGLIAENYGWPNIFLFLISSTIILTTVIAFRLPETHHLHNRKPISILEVALKLIKDKKVVGYGLIVGGCNGIYFSYFAEGPFYLISMLKLSPSQYGLSFIGFAVFTMLGGIISLKLNNYYPLQTIVGHGLKLILASNLIFCSAVLLHYKIFDLPNNILIIIVILSQMLVAGGICIATSNALALALVDYKWCIGTASSLFGFFYYSLVSIITLLMGTIHNGTLVPMPLYFLVITVIMISVLKIMILNKGRISSL